MKTITLQRPDLVTMVDDWNYAYLSQFRWYADWNEHCQTYYVKRNYNDYGDRKTERMHRIIMGLGSGDSNYEPTQGKRKPLIDHIDFDGLNNQESNLRIATSIQNQANRRKHRSANGVLCSSKYKGVSRRANGKWQVVIKSGNVNYYLGTYEDEDVAALVWNDMAKKLHGEWALLNEVG